MKNEVTVPLPLNFTDADAALYKPYQKYYLRPQKVKKLKNVFVTFSGFCINNKGLIRECHHNYELQYNDYLNEAALHYYNVSDNPGNLITLDNETVYLAIHHPWFNYYHWLCESIFRLWMVRNQLQRLVLILPEYYRDADFIMGSLEPFEIPNIFFIPDGKSLMVRNLCLPQLKPICDSYNTRHLRQVREFYTFYVNNVKKLTNDLGHRLYVSRQLAKRRKVVNEEEVQGVLQRHGFAIFHPEQYSFLEQVAIFSKVKYLVGEHGSGLTNLLFVPDGASILELHKNQTNELDHPSPLFWYMAHSLKINYYHQSCKTHGKEDYFDGNYIVDVANLESNLSLMLKDN
jgi:capsular polysaccharide biosynthesis protein